MPLSVHVAARAGRSLLVDRWEMVAIMATRFVHALHEPQTLPVTRLCLRSRCGRSFATTYGSDQDLCPTCQQYNTRRGAVA